ncbi:MAG: glycosyltransferase [Elainellaceae cyanobacterium]
MKILHVIPSVSPVRGGPSQAVLEMVNALCQQGIMAEIVTTNDHGPDLLDVPLQQWVKYPLPASEQSVSACFFPRFSPKISAIREFAFSGAFTAWLWQHISDYDLVHIHAIFSYPSTIAIVIARLQKVPYIIRPIGQLCEWSLQQGARKKQIYLDLVERANLNHCQFLHLTSEQEQQEVAKLNLNTPNFILPLGFSFPAPISNARQRLRQHLSLPPDEPVILFLSRLHPKKGLDYLIPALGKLTNHQFTFVLAGSGAPAYEAQIESLLISNGIRDRTRLTGFVEGETKNLLLQGSDLFALTSHSENFGVAVLEAMASGLPVLLTPGVALATEVKQHQLGYVTQLNTSDIASTLEEYLTSHQQAKAMGQRACQFVRDYYTWDKIAANLIQVYQAITDRQPVSALTSYTPLSNKPLA